MGPAFNDCSHAFDALLQAVKPLASVRAKSIAIFVSDPTAHRGDRAKRAEQIVNSIRPKADVMLLWQTFPILQFAEGDSASLDGLLFLHMSPAHAPTSQSSRLIVWCRRSHRRRGRGCSLQLAMSFNTRRRSHLRQGPLSTRCDKEEIFWTIRDTRIKTPRVEPCHTSGILPCMIRSLSWFVVVIRRSTVAASVV